MAGSAFMKLLGQSGEILEGESVHTAYKSSDGWFEVSDWGWDVESEHKHTGTGLAVGRAKPGIFNFTHSFDKSSPLMLSYMIQGMHFKTVQVDMLKQTGQSTPECYFRFTAGSVFVTKLSNKADEEGKLTQEVECVFKEVNIQYMKQLPSGALSKDGCLEFMWNMAEQTFTNSAAIVVQKF